MMTYKLLYKKIKNWIKTFLNSCKRKNKEKW